MLKYKGTYINLIPLLMRKYMVEQFGKDLTGRALKKTPGIYRKMLQQVDDIGFDNPMVDNIYMGFVFMAIWKAADGAIDMDSYRRVIKKFMRSFIVQKVIGGKDFNNH